MRAHAENEQELLRASERVDGQEDAAAARDDLVHERREAGLARLALLVHVRAVRALRDEHVGTQRRQLGRHQVPVLLPAEVARIEHLRAATRPTLNTAT